MGMKSTTFRVLTFSGLKKVCSKKGWDLEPLVRIPKGQGRPDCSPKGGRTPAPAQTGLGRSICGGKKRALGGSFAFPAKVGSGHRATPLGSGKFL